MPFTILKASEIKEARKKLGMTQAELARLCEVTQPYIAKIEAGMADPKFSVIQKISEILSGVEKKGRLLPVEKIMSSPVIFARPEDPVEKAVRRMESNGISQLPVLDEGIQVGSLTETTVLRRLSGGKKFHLVMKERISVVMDEPFPSVGKDESIEVLYPLLENRPAAVVTEKGKVIGIVTKADLFKLRRYER